jgi:uncharacterized protein
MNNYYEPDIKTFWNYSGVVLMMIILLVANLTFAPAIALVMAKIKGMDLQEFLNAVQGNSGYSFTNTARQFHFFSFIIYMFFPAALFLTINRTSYGSILGYKLPGPKQLTIIFVLILACIPLAMLGVYGMEQLPWPDAVRSFANNLNSTRQIQFDLLLQMPHLGHLAVCLFLLAALPAFCEELIFRGIMMPIIAKKTGKFWIGLLVQALIFALLHFSMYELLTIFLLGAMLGWVAYTYGLVASMAAHFIFNSTTVIAEYAAQHGSPQAAAVAQNNILPNGALLILGVIIVVFIIARKPWAKP